MAQIFFIVGRGRSGTTLLARMLTRHPQLAVAPEGFFAMSLYQKYRSGPWDTKRIEAFCRDLLREQRMRRWGLDMEWLYTRLAEREGRLDYQQVCLEVYTAYAESVLGRRAPAWVGDKNPHYALLIPRIDRLFPQARYV
jgi:Sulfotransferase family